MTGEKALAFMKAKLNRPLTQFEHDIANHPRVCAVSGEYDTKEELIDCKKCFCVAFKAKYYDEGMAKHEKWCKALKIAAEDYKNEQTIGHQVKKNLCLIFDLL